MADTLPQNFPSPSESATASYDYIDLAEGTGVILLYGYHQKENTGGETQALNRNILSSNSIGTTVSSAGTTIHTYNLSDFNTPRTIQGTAYVQLSAYRGNTGDGFAMHFTFQKVSGATVTDFGESTMNVDSTPNATAKTYTIPITLTQTNFKIGDNLRIEAEYTKTNGASTISWGHDPLNRDFTNLTAATYPTQLKFFVPFKINL